MQLEQNRFVQIEKRHKILESEFQDLFVALNRRTLASVVPPQLTVGKLAIKLCDNVVTPKSLLVPDCTTCGACCAYLLCVAVKHSDDTPADAFWNITNETAAGEITVDRFMRRNSESGACAALDGKLGEEALCRIYPNRPQVCREFEAGSDKCRALRRAYGFEPELTAPQKLEAEFRLELDSQRRSLSTKIVYAKIVQHPETGETLIAALLDNDSHQILRIYDPAKESWLQSEFANLTLPEAFRLIESRLNANQTEQNARA